jgi:hypothetical protein
MAPGNIFYESTLPQISPPSVTFIYEATGRGQVKTKNH